MVHVATKYLAQHIRTLKPTLAGAIKQAVAERAADAAARVGQLLLLPEHPAPESNDSDSIAYLAQQTMLKSILADAVQKVIAERAADPVARLGQLLLEAAAPPLAALAKPADALDAMAISAAAPAEFGL